MTIPGGSSESFNKFNYLLRPSKQVERKLIIQALQTLALGGFDIPNYTYLGLGSVYYADFILFHKYLYINDMVCAEASNIPKRMRFNRPYKFIRLKMAKVGDILPTLNRKRKYFVWLDYDSVLGEDILYDTAGALHVLAPESILLVTVEAEPALPEGSDGLNQAQLVRRLVELFRPLLGRYVGKEITRSEVAHNSLPRLFAEALRTQFIEELAKRDLNYFPLFNFKYADGAQMLSLGGILGDRQIRDRLKRSGVYRFDFINTGVDPLRISIPPLTAREKQWLDQNIDARLTAERLKFELNRDLLENFRRYYRHYPTYYETLL